MSISPPVELLHFAGCPHVEAARDQLRRAFGRAGLAPAWVEIDVTSPDAPAYARQFGSPTILVAGCDVAGGTPVGGQSCRVYPGSDTDGVPSLDDIVRALRALPDS